MVTNILRIEDLSIYDELMPYLNPTVQVLAPGFTDAVLFNATTTPTVVKGFALNLTACNLGLQSSDCGIEFNDVPDGVYTVKYSISPNSQLFVEFNHLRTTALKVELKKQLSKLQLGACLPSAEVTAKFELLKRVSMYLDAAKAMAEYKLDQDKAMVLYNYAKKILDKFECKNC